MQSLSDLELNVQQLLLRYDAIEQENASLQQQVEKQREEIIRTHGELAQLQKQYRQLQTAFALIDNETNKQKAKQHLNYLIQRIDLAISTLKQ